MKWEKLSDYCIKSGSYQIAKSVVMNKPTYTLFFGNENLGKFADADTARQAATNHDANELMGTV